jgi:P27 family predicted phage terminase small subunit
VLRLLKGSPSHHRKNKLEPLPDKDAITPPEYLAGASLAKWNQVLPGLIATGVVTNADVETLARYCTMYEAWLQCLRQIRRAGDWFAVYDKSGKMVNAKSTPSALMVVKLAAGLLRIEQEFGMTPSARGNIVANKKQAQPEIDPRIFG